MRALKTITNAALSALCLIAILILIVGLNNEIPQSDPMGYCTFLLLCLLGFKYGVDGIDMWGDR